MRLRLYLFSALLAAIHSYKIKYPTRTIQYNLLNKPSKFNKKDLQLFSLENALTLDKNDIAQTTNFNSQYDLTIPQVIYVTLTTLFVTCLIVADFIGVKIFEIKLPFSVLSYDSIEHTCGMLTFPLTFLLSDIINEYYGPEATKRTVYLGLWMSLIVCVVVNIAQALPYLNKPFNVTPAAFDMIFGSAKALYAASLCAYLVGQLTDIWLFGLIKRWTKGKYLWLRAAVSTLVSQLLDSFIVSLVAFRIGKIMTGQIPATLKEVFNISVTGYGLKFIVAGLVTPVLYFVRDILQNRYKLRPIPADYNEIK